MIKQLVRIQQYSDFSMDVQLPETYDGQRFIITLFTGDDLENKYVASYNRGVYTNCEKVRDKIVVFVDSPTMQLGCLRIKFEIFDIDGNYADGMADLANATRTNIYIVEENPNAVSASYKPSLLPDLSDNYVTEHEMVEVLKGYVTTEEFEHGTADYVTNTELNNAGYISSIPSEYVTESEISAMSYVTKTELNNAGYISSIPSEYVTESEISAMSYATVSYVAEYVATHTGDVDLSAYVTDEQLHQELEAYVSKNELNNASYITQNVLDNASYASTSYVAEYVSTHTGDIDLNDYVTKTELSNAGYITSIPSEYITESELNSALSSYATKTYVANYVSQHGGNVDLSAYAKLSDLNSYVSKTELGNASYLTYNSFVSYLNAAGYLTSAIFQYDSNSNTLTIIV